MNRYSRNFANTLWLIDVNPSYTNMDNHRELEIK